MAKKCGKCDPHEICEECPEWIFTLADLIMCMMGLFVILWVLKPGPKEEVPQASEDMIKVVAAIREAFGYIPDPDSDDPVDMHLLMKKLERLKLNGPGEKGRTLKHMNGASGTDDEVTSIRPGQQAVVGGRLQFDRGQALLTASALEQLDQVAMQIRGHRNIVLVKGHTAPDDLSEGASAQEKMDLSLRRAQAVADHLTRHGVSPDIIRVQGCSTFEPLKQRVYTPESQSMNRRVEVEATNTLVEQFQDAPRQDPTTLTTPARETPDPSLPSHSSRSQPSASHAAPEAHPHVPAASH